MVTGITTAQDNFNFELLNNTEVGESGNDVWGWVDGNGTEYAIMGSRTNTWIWSLEDPANPTLRSQIPGDASTWRDIKSWEDHLYVTTDSGDDGLLIVDMSQAPDSIRHQYIKPPIVSANGDSTALGPCHNLYIDENGFCYLAGCRIGYGNKAIIFDLNQDKWTPPVVGVHGNIPNGGGYAHDLYVKNNIMYASEINEGQLGIYDCTRKDSLILLGNENTGFNFTHNAWTSTDQNYVFTTDERPNAFVEAYDVSDPNNITFLDRFQPLETVGEGVIPHNTHYYDGYLVTSYYTDGIVITDATKPDNLIKVGAYDTFLGPHGGFSGCWGAYPYLPSGLVLASDINSGLYVFQPTYVRAARLEGVVTDSETGDPLNGVLVEIETDQVNYEESAADGTYKTGVAAQGLLTVTAYHPEYVPFTTEVELVNGDVTILDIELERIPLANFTIKVVSEMTGEAIPDAVVSFEDLDAATNIEKAITDANGEVALTLPAKFYILNIGKWGYQLNSQVINGASLADYDVELSLGYEDSFALDLGWSVNGTAITGMWERGVPNGTVFNNQEMAPNRDSGTDNDLFCYVTGNENTGQAADDDVDNGTAQLVSPAFDMEDRDILEITVDLWFSVAGGNGAPDDTLSVYLHEKEDSILLTQISANTMGWNEDIQLELELAEFVEEGKELRLSFQTEDKIQSGHILEAGVDNVRINGVSLTSTSETDRVAYQVAPNPFDEVFTVHFTQAGDRQLILYNELGQMMYRKQCTSESCRMNPGLVPGVYILNVIESNGQIHSSKLIKN